MTRIASIVIFAYIVLVSCLSAQKAYSQATFDRTWWVPEDFPTIQEAIDAAVHGDRIVVATGTYYENLKMHGKNVRLQSQDPWDPEIVKNTIIDGQHRDSVIEFNGSETVDSEICGFTIQNGSAICGGGVQGNSCSGTVQMCRVVNNFALARGGGMHAFLSLDSQVAPIFKRNFIAFNVTEGYGGGLADFGSLTPLVLSLIWANQAAYGGGMAYCYRAYGCTIYGNTATELGGGMYLCGSLSEVILWGNRALNSDVPYQQNIYWDPSDVPYPGDCAIEDARPSWPWCRYPTHGMIDADNGVFELRADSPVQDIRFVAHNANPDYKGRPRLYDSIPNITGFDGDLGALERSPYGYREVFEMSQLLNESEFYFLESLDLNGDRLVDKADLMELIRLMNDHRPTDLRVQRPQR